MTPPLQLGFIGCGGHSKRHAEVALNMPRLFRVVGACDIDPAASEDFDRQFCEKFMPGGGSRAFTDVSDLLSLHELDAVVIGTPHRFHLDLCEQALLAGKHVLCEKPLWEGPHLEKGKRLLELASQNGLVFSSCHLRRFEDEYMYVKGSLPELCERFGKAMELRFQFFYHQPSTAWKMSDSLLLDHMNHEIDLVHFFFGHTPAKFWRLSHSFDEYTVAGKTSSGLSLWFSGSRRLPSHVFRNELEIIFETGRIRVVGVLDSLSGLVSSRVQKESFDGSYEETFLYEPHPYNDALVRVMKNFAQAIRGEEDSYLTSQDLITNTSICNDLIVNEHGSIL